MDPRCAVPLLLPLLLLSVTPPGVRGQQQQQPTQAPNSTGVWAPTSPSETLATIALTPSRAVTLGPRPSSASAATNTTNATADASSNATAAAARGEEPGRPLYIVGFFPLTGDSFHRGSSALLAANLALEHINDRPDVLPGYRLALNWNDSFCIAGVATQALFEHINSGIQYHMLLGAGCSAVAQTVSLAADLWNIIQVSYAASSPALSVRNQYKSFFRTNAADSQYNHARLALIKWFNWSKVATLHENREVFSTSINDFSTLLADNGIDLITSESFTVDPKEQVKNLKDKGAWIIFGNFYENMARRVFCEAFHEGLYGKHYAWFLPSGYQERWWEEPDDDVTCTSEELYQAITGYISTENIPLSVYKDRVTASGYTARQYEQIIDELFAVEENTTDFSANKAAASYAYDATWTIALALNNSLGTSNGLDDFHYENTEMREAFMDTLYNLEFEGVSGTVSFTSVGNREGLIEVRQMKDEREESIGQFSPQREELNVDGIVWQGGRAPKDETTRTNVTLYVPRVYVYVAVGLSGFGALLAMVFGTLLLFYKQRSVFSRAMPGYLGLLLIGSVLLYASVVLLGVDSGLVGQEYLTLVCKVSSSTITIGFACTYGVLFAKIYRAHKLLVTKTNLWKPDPHGAHMARTMAIFFLVDIVTLVVWIVAFPMTSNTEVVNERTNADENTLYRDIVEFCTKGDSIYFIVGLFVFHGLSLLLGAFLSYETRELKIISLNDTFVTGLAVYCVVTLSVVGAPLSFILASSPSVSYAVLGTLVWTAVTLTLFVVFVPKLAALRHTFCDRLDADSRTDKEIYDEEVDEETKIRHKIDEVDHKIELVKREVDLRTRYGRQGVRRGCGLWCFGHFLGCNCGQLTGEVAQILASYSPSPSAEQSVVSPGRSDADSAAAALAYDNKALQVSDWNLDREIGEGSTDPGVVGPADSSDAARCLDSSDVTLAVEASYHDPPSYSSAAVGTTQPANGRAGSATPTDDDDDDDDDGSPDAHEQGSDKAKSLEMAPPIDLKETTVAGGVWAPGNQDGDVIESTMM